MAVITVVGLGPGDGTYLLPQAQEALAAAEILVGGRRALNRWASPGQETFAVDAAVEQVLEFIVGRYLNRRVAVLVSGDPGFYSLLGALRRRFAPADLEVIPGLSSLQLAFARVKLPWQEARLVSLHGRSWEELPSWREEQTLAVLTDPRHTPADLAVYLQQHGWEDRPVYVCSDLGWPEEKVLETTLGQLARFACSANSVVILPASPPAELPGDAAWPWCTPGIPEDQFSRGDVPLSKEEVRAVALAKARMAPHHRVWDIGAGSGGMAVEAALQCSRGAVWAVERDPRALAVLAANQQRFCLHNLQIVAGEAPGALAGLPPPHRVIVGGSGGRLASILQEVDRRLLPGGRVVLTAVTLDTLQEGLSTLEELGWDVAATGVQVTRLEHLGRHRLFRGLNPVYIISGSKGET